MGPINELPPNASRVRVRMFHTDMYGAVFHGTWFSLFEEARTEVFRRHGYRFADSEGDSAYAMIVTDIGAQFHKPALMDDELAIAITVPQLSRVRCQIAYTASQVETGELVTSGHTTFVCVDRVTGRPIAMPANLRGAIERCPGMLLPDARKPPRRL